VLSDQRKHPGKEGPQAKKRTPFNYKRGMWGRVGMEVETHSAGTFAKKCLFRQAAEGGRVPVGTVKRKERKEGRDSETRQVRELQIVNKQEISSRLEISERRLANRLQKRKKSRSGGVLLKKRSL